jgi:hypothetical protein
MPSPRHDAISRLFTDHPGFAVEILRDLLHVELPAGIPVQVETKFNDRPSKDLQPDAVITVGPPHDPVHGIVVEIQQNKTESKRRQLPRYAAALWLMLSCPVTVLVICPTATAAAWYAERVHTKLPGYVFQAAVVGPDQIPVITDPHEAAAQPDLAALAVMAHGWQRKVTQAFVDGLFGQGITRLSYEHAVQYNEYAWHMAVPPVKRILEEILASSTWLASSPFAREHFSRGVAEGEAKGEAKAILLMLSARGVEVSEEARARISGCDDLDQLEAWVRRAATAGSIDDLFR